MWRLEQQATVDDDYEEAPNEIIETTTYNEPRNSLSGSSVYSEPNSPTRQPTPVPVVSHAYLHVTSRDTDTDNLSVNMTSGTISNEQQIDSGISSDISPSSVVIAPYYGLESSTLEPPPAPVDYTSLEKPVYYNTEFATSEATNDKISDEQRSASGSSIHRSISTSSEDETTV